MTEYILIALIIIGVFTVARLSVNYIIIPTIAVIVFTIACLVLGPKRAIEACRSLPRKGGAA